MRSSSLLVLSLAASFAASADPAQALVGGRYEASVTPPVELVDKRPTPAERPAKIPTLQGNKDRVGDEQFEQAPLEAFAKALTDQLAPDFVAMNRRSIEVVAFDVAIGDRSGRTLDFEGAPVQPAYFASPTHALGAVIAGAFLQMIEHNKGSKPIFLSVALDHQGNKVSCHGIGFFPGEHAAGGWQKALMLAASDCARLLENRPPMENLAGPGRMVR